VKVAEIEEETVADGITTLRSALQRNATFVLGQSPLRPFIVLISGVTVLMSSFESHTIAGICTTLKLGTTINILFK
jgi:hypothetical protein